MAIFITIAVHEALTVSSPWSPGKTAEEVNKSVCVCVFAMAKRSECQHKQSCVGRVHFDALFWHPFGDAQRARAFRGSPLHCREGPVRTLTPGMFDKQQLLRPRVNVRRGLCGRINSWDLLCWRVTDEVLTATTGVLYSCHSYCSVPVRSVYTWHLWKGRMRSQWQLIPSMLARHLWRLWHLRAIFEVTVTI